MPKCIGLVGGLGIGAGIHYYQQLAKAHEARGSGLQLVMVHAQMARVFEHVQAGDAPGLARYLAEIVERLRGGGAEVAAIPAATPHLCIKELTAISPLPIVDLLSVADEAIRTRGFRRVALFGTRFVIETGMFGGLHGVELVTPRPEEVDLIHSTYLQIAQRGHGTPDQYAALTKLAHSLCSDDRADAIILAGTDLSALFNESNIDFPFLDCAAAHITAIMRAVFDTDSKSPIAASR